MRKTVTTTLREDEVEQIDQLWPEYSRAENTRVLLRFALRHQGLVISWFNHVNGRPIDQPEQEQE